MVVNMCRRVTIMPKDMQLALRIRGEKWNMAEKRSQEEERKRLKAIQDTSDWYRKQERKLDTLGEKVKEIQAKKNEAVVKAAISHCGRDQILPSEGKEEKKEISSKAKATMDRLMAAEASGTGSMKSRSNRIDGGGLAVQPPPAVSVSKPPPAPRARRMSRELRALGIVGPVVLNA